MSDTPSASILHCSLAFEIPCKISDLRLQPCGVLSNPGRDRSFCPWVRRTVSSEKGMAGKLKPLDIQREEKPGKYADGDGLYPVVTGPTSKNWSTACPRRSSAAGAAFLNENGAR